MLTKKNFFVIIANLFFERQVGGKTRGVSSVPGLAAAEVVCMYVCVCMVFLYYIPSNGGLRLSTPVLTEVLIFVMRFYAENTSLVVLRRA